MNCAMLGLRRCGSGREGRRSPSPITGTIIGDGLDEFDTGHGNPGMSGIRPRNGFIVRPLLCVSREDILAWLADQGYAYMVDSTNLSDAYTRNFIRLNVLPLLRR